MTFAQWIAFLWNNPKHRLHMIERKARDDDEQRRLREVWLRLERVGREIQAIAAKENERA